jgi:hypothetical protein
MDFYAPTARVISTEIMISLLIFNKMINLYFQFVLKKQFKNKEKIKTLKQSLKTMKSKLNQTDTN